MPLEYVDEGSYSIFMCGVCGVPEEDLIFSCMQCGDFICDQCFTEQREVVTIAVDWDDDGYSETLDDIRTIDDERSFLCNACYDNVDRETLHSPGRCRLYYHSANIDELLVNCNPTDLCGYCQERLHNLEKTRLHQELCEENERLENEVWNLTNWVRVLDDALHVTNRRMNLARQFLNNDQGDSDSDIIEI